MRPRVLLATALAALVAGCNSSYPNPFEEGTPSSPPPADAAFVFTGNAQSAAPGAGRELFASDPSGTSLARLTFCTERAGCDSVEAAIAADRRRAIVRRRSSDTNGDGRIDDADFEALFYLDLERQVEAELVPALHRVSGIDWSPTEDLLVYSAQGPGGEDLFRTTPVRPTDDNKQQTRNLTCPPGAGGAPSCDISIRERRPRIDPSGSVAAYERIDASGKGRIYIFQTSVTQQQVTEGGPGDAALPGTPYVVGSDADPDYSPDGRSLVFRRATGIGLSGRGVWDLLVVGTDGRGLRAVATGAAYRGAPDWGPDGILFPEIDASGVPRLVLVQPDGSARRIVLSLNAGFEISYPRWLP